MLHAHLAALRADCSRRAVGAVIVRERHVISTGYNGALAGELGCLKGGCPRGLKSYNEIKAGSDYTGNCIAFHAEENALLASNKLGISVQGASIYVTTEPCYKCSRLIQQAGISEVFWNEELA